MVRTRTQKTRELKLRFGVKLVPYVDLSAPKPYKRGAPRPPRSRAEQPSASATPPRKRRALRQRHPSGVPTNVGEPSVSMGPHAPNVPAPTQVPSNPVSARPQADVPAQTLPEIIPSDSNQKSSAQTAPPPRIVAAGSSPEPTQPQDAAPARPRGTVEERRKAFVRDLQKRKQARRGITRFIPKKTKTIAVPVPSLQSEDSMPGLKKSTRPDGTIRLDFSQVRYTQSGAVRETAANRPKTTSRKTPPRPSPTITRRAQIALKTPSSSRVRLVERPITPLEEPLPPASPQHSPTALPDITSPFLREVWAPWQTEEAEYAIVDEDGGEIEGNSDEYNDNFNNEEENEGQNEDEGGEEQGREQQQEEEEEEEEEQKVVGPIENEEEENDHHDAFDLSSDATDDNYSDGPRQEQELKERRVERNRRHRSKSTKGPVAARKSSQSKKTRTTTRKTFKSNNAARRVAKKTTAEVDSDSEDDTPLLNPMLDPDCPEYEVDAEVYEEVPGPLSSECRKALNAAAFEFETVVHRLARQYQKSTDSLIRAAGFAFKSHRQDSIWNDYQAYQTKHLGHKPNPNESLREFSVRMSEEYKDFWKKELGNEWRSVDRRREVAKRQGWAGYAQRSRETMGSKERNEGVKPVTMRRCIDEFMKVAQMAHSVYGLIFVGQLHDINNHNRSRYFGWGDVYERMMRSEKAAFSKGLKATAAKLRTVHEEIKNGLVENQTKSSIITAYREDPTAVKILRPLLPRILGVDIAEATDNALDKMRWHNFGRLAISQQLRVLNWPEGLPRKAFAGYDRPPNILSDPFQGHGTRILTWTLEEKEKPLDQQGDLPIIVDTSGKTLMTVNDVLNAPEEGETGGEDGSSKPKADGQTVEEEAQRRRTSNSKGKQKVTFDLFASEDDDDDDDDDSWWPEGALEVGPTLPGGPLAPTEWEDEEEDLPMPPPGPSKDTFLEDLRQRRGWSPTDSPQPLMTTTARKPIPIQTARTIPKVAPKADQRKVRTKAVSTAPKAPLPGPISVPRSTHTTARTRQDSNTLPVAAIPSRSKTSLPKPAEVKTPAGPSRNAPRVEAVGPSRQQGGGKSNGIQTLQKRKGAPKNNDEELLPKKKKKVVSRD
ncbi:hypothetical protein K435DRAFT_867884 [Dendrothele bispora CBS 962.96]|uniref:Uncharacterized protein n=1 Tax=Dendrothele bispora (strain CBS 962.96) TaxID=1314807 RepID=A0A4S8LDU9_DENBC|nr:hypothetical protein K435DRAFT_867884 [Dendrothele bispora CBS 962.96]